jgi:hypothetical protein
VPDVARRLAELRQVLPDAEAATRAGDDHGTDVVGARLLEALRQRRVHGGVERVQHVGPVEGEREDVAVACRPDLGHATRPHHAAGTRQAVAFHGMIG